MRSDFMKLLSVGLLAGALTACGPQLTDPNAGTAEGTKDTNSPAEGEFVTVGISVSESAALGFSLAAATDFDMSLEGCASGLTYSGLNATTPNIDLYKFDQGCIVKLNSFQFGGNTYAPNGTDDFTSWTAGDLAIFVNTLDANDQLRVSVSSQVSDPVDAGDTIAYAFSEIQAGADELIAKSIVADNHTLSVDGVDAPNFTISAVSFQGITATGAGQFTFTLTCAGTMAGTDPNETCDGLNLQDIDYKLVADTYSGTLNQTNLDAIFPTGESSVAEVDETVDGFNTVSLEGPAAMHANPNMILIIEASDTSYLYFNVDVTTLSYP